MGFLPRQVYGRKSKIRILKGINDKIQIKSDKVQMTKVQKQTGRLVFFAVGHFLFVLLLDLGF
jgi:hypothetical protein